MLLGKRTYGEWGAGPLREEACGPAGSAGEVGGPGAIEETMDVTVGRRLKAHGTSWYRLGAHHLPTPKILKQNGGWARY